MTDGVFAGPIRLSLAVVTCGALACHDGSSSGVCMLVDAAGPAVAAEPTQIGALSCATMATPDATTPSALFQVDTGGIFVGQPAEYSVGGAYGQPSCPDQFLVEADLSAANAAGRNVSVTGFWSVLVPGDPCAYRATMTVWGYDGSDWVLHDRLVYEGEPFNDNAGTPRCNARVTSRVVPSDLGAVTIPANRFTRGRIAVIATDCDHKLPVDIVLQVL